MSLPWFEQEFTEIDEGQRAICDRNDTIVDENRYTNGYTLGALFYIFEVLTVL